VFTTRAAIALAKPNSHAVNQTVIRFMMLLMDGNQPDF
jgi:hypothetical protein